MIRYAVPELKVLDDIQVLGGEVPSGVPLPLDVVFIRLTATSVTGLPDLESESTSGSIQVQLPGVSPATTAKSPWKTDLIVPGDADPTAETEESDTRGISLTLTATTGLRDIVKFDGLRLSILAVESTSNEDEPGDVQESTKLIASAAVPLDGLLDSSASSRGPALLEKRLTLILEPEWSGGTPEATVTLELNPTDLVNGFSEDASVVTSEICIPVPANQRK